MNKKPNSKKRKSRAKEAVKKRKDESAKIAKDCLLAGHNSDEAKRLVVEYRKTQRLSLNPATINVIVNNANSLLSEEFGKDKAHVISLHIERYNQDIIRLLETENPFEKEWEIEQEIIKKAGRDNQTPEEIRELVNDMIEQVFGERDHVTLAKLKPQLINTYYTVLSTIHAKERVLQMHTKGFQVHIVNRLNVEVKEERKYDLSKLTFDQKLDFLQLVLKCKKTDEEIGSVILRSDTKKEETIDIEHEVVEDAPNIDKIKHEDKPLLSPPKNDRALLDVSAKLAETLKKKAQEAFEKAGSKITQ